MGPFTARIVVAASFVAALASCKPTGNTPDTPDALASPQASAIPAPLANVPATITSANAFVVTSPEGGPPPTPMRGDVPLQPDALATQGVGYTLSAVIRPADLMGPPRAMEVNNAGLEAARRKTELRLGIDLGPARMRVQLVGNGFILPAETEIRARADRYGHVVVWPGGTTYRPIAPGALRALIGERRFDVAPITPADIVTKEETGKRIGIRTRKVEVATRAAKATFEIGRLVDLGEGGILLCRVLLDLMNAPPASNVCGLDEIPVRAELRWTGKGSLAFELTGVLKRTDMPMTPLLVPPSAGVFAALAPPTGGVVPMLTSNELAAFRTNPVDVPAQPTPPTDSLLVSNATDQLRVLYIDGIPVAWALPNSKDVVPGFVRGRYVAQWRTFLGELVEPPVTLVIPGVASIGAPPDAGAK